MRSPKEVMGLIISVVVIIGVLTLSCVVFLYLNLPPGKTAPKITCACERYEDDYLVTITSASHPGGVSCFKYYIENGDITVVSGRCDDVYNIDPTFQDENGNLITNVSFCDVDTNAKLSAGDVFYIRGVNNSEIYNNKGERVPGIGRNGLVFKLQYLPAGTMSCVINIADNVSVNTTFVKHHPLNKWNIIPIPVPAIPLPNITILTSEPTLSSYPPMKGQNVSIALTLNNSDNVSVSNISVKFYDDNVEIKSVENISTAAMDKTRILVYHHFDTELTHNITISVVLRGIEAIRGYCEVYEIVAPPAITYSFYTDITIILFVAVIVALIMSYCKVKSQRYKKC